MMPDVTAGDSASAIYCSACQELVAVISTEGSAHLGGLVQGLVERHAAMRYDCRAAVPVIVVGERWQTVVQIQRGDRQWGVEGT